MTTIYNIGAAAQKSLTNARGPGANIFLDDGRCSGWGLAANTRLGPGNFWTTTDPQVLQAVLSSGKMCEIATAWKSGERIFTLDNNGWNLLVRFDNQPIEKTVLVKSTSILSWKTRTRNAVRFALTKSPGPKNVAFSPLAGVDLPNTYRSR